MSPGDDISPVTIGRLLQSVEDQTRAIDAFTQSHREMCGEVRELREEMIEQRAEVRADRTAIADGADALRCVKNRLNEGDKSIRDHGWQIRVLALLIVIVAVVGPQVGDVLMRIWGRVF